MVGFDKLALIRLTRKKIHINIFRWAIDYEDPSMNRIDFKKTRSFPRAPIGVVVRVQTPEGTYHYQSKNLSAGGVFLLTDKPLNEETKVVLHIMLPSISKPVCASGEVVWKQRQEPSGFAVKFTDIDEGGQKLIRWTVERYLDQHGL